MFWLVVILVKGFEVIKVFLKCFDLGKEFLLISEWFLTFAFLERFRILIVSELIDLFTLYVLIFIKD